MNQVRGVRAADVNPQHLVRCLVRDDLYHPRDLTHGMGLPEPPVLKPADLVPDSQFDCLFFPEADTADFRHGEDSGRDNAIVHAGTSAEGVVHGNDSLPRGNVRQHHLPGDIANR